MTCYFVGQDEEEEAQDRPGGGSSLGDTGSDIEFKEESTGWLQHPTWCLVSSG